MGGATDYPESVAKTWSITLDQLDPPSSVALAYRAWFAPETIPRGVFSEKPLLSEALGGNGNVSDLAIHLALAELDRFSLVRLTREAVSVHRLLQAVEQDSLSGEDCECSLDQAVRLFNALAPGFPDDPRTWDVWLSLWPHAEALMEHTKRHVMGTLPIALRRMSRRVSVCARLVRASRAGVSRALAIHERALGPADVAVLLKHLSFAKRIIVTATGQKFRLTGDRY